MKTCETCKYFIIDEFDFTPQCLMKLENGCVFYKRNWKSNQNRCKFHKELTVDDVNRLLGLDKHE